MTACDPIPDDQVTTARRRPGLPGLRAVTLSDPAQVREIWSQWDDLAVLTRRPYCAPAWMMAWWRHVAPRGALLRIVAVFDGEELVAIAPFFADRGLGGVARYRLLSAGTAVPLDILARPGSERAVAGLIAQALSGADPSPDTLMLEGVLGGSPWPELLRDAWRGRGTLRQHTLFAQRLPFVELRGITYDAWFASKSSKYRRKLRHEMKDMREHGITVRRTTDANELACDLQAFADLHGARWSKRGGSGVLDARVERMLAEVGEQLLDDGRFRLWSMDADGRCISSHLFVAAGGEVAYWLGGFDERETRIRRPGILTIRVALEHAFGIGDERLDLGPGDQPYKYDFAQAASSAEWILLIPPGRRSLLARGQLARLRVRILVAQRLSPKAKRLVRRVLEWRPARRQTEGAPAR